MDGTLYKNFRYSLRKFFTSLLSTKNIYLDDSRQNYPDGEVIEVLTNLGGSEHEVKPSFSSFFQILVIADSPEITAATILSKFDSENRKISIYDIVGDNPTTEIGTIELTRIESRSLPAPDGGRKIEAITAYYRILES